MRIKGMITRLEDVLQSVRNGVPHDLTFKPTYEMTDKQVAHLQRKLNESFEIWSGTWIIPNLEGLITYLEDELRAQKERRRK